MDGNVIVRDETQEDIRAIHEVTIAAFETLEISNHTEHFIIGELRAANALTLSLVAQLGDRVVGHVAFSPVTMSDGTRDWYGLGPVSVLPGHQRNGIGSKLIENGLLRLRELAARGCCLVGHPEYYRRFGFVNTPGLVLDGVPPDVFFALSFDGSVPRGTVAIHPAFMAAGPA